MKKADPNAIIDRFKARAGGSLADWRAIDTAITTHAASTDTLRLRRRAASDSFLSLIIAWEAFLTGWITAAVNREPTKASATLAKQLRSYGSDELRIPSRVISTSLLVTSHLTLKDVRGIIDRSGFNIPVRSHKELQQIKKKWLGGDFETKVHAISPQDFSPALVGRLVRNAIAHESDAALNDVNEAARHVHVKPALKVIQTRNLDVRSWRRYILQTEPGTATPRVEVFHTELCSLAEAFRASY